MKAGRELDLLIAEKIMGELVVEKKESFPHFYTYKHITLGSAYDDWPPGKYVEKFVEGKVGNQDRTDWFHPSPYSSDISYAIKVIEKVTSEEWTAFTIDFRPKQADHGKAWEEGAKFIIKTTYGGQGPYPGVDIVTNNLPEAICLAALGMTK